MRKEHDFLGELEVADELYYGVQTIRALENFHITGKHLDQDFIKALAMVKKASACLLYTSRDWLHTAGLYFKPDGTGKAISQEQLPGTVVSPGTPIVVQFSH